MRAKKFYLAKVSISENIFSSAENRSTIINTYIPKALLKENVTIEYENCHYKITDKNSLEFNDETYIYGNLTRVTKMKATIVEGEQTREKEFEEDKAIPVEFYYNIQKEIIAYRTCTEITSEKFLENFKKIIELDPRIGDVKIIPYTSKNSIREFFEELDVVTEINFYLIKPNNPGSKEYYDFEEIINDNNLKELNINMSNSQGIKYQKEGSNEFTDTIESGISLTESAYGYTEVKGYVTSEVPGKRKDKKRTKKEAKSATSAQYPRYVAVKRLDTKVVLQKVHSVIKSLF